MKLARKFRFSFAIAAVAAFSLTLFACDRAHEKLEDVVTYLAPPVDLYEIRPVLDPQTEIWRPGYWSLTTGGEFVWIPGEVVPRPTPTATWSAPRWFQRAYGWTFEPGHWE